MQPIDYWDEGFFYGILWAAAFLACLFRTCSNDTFVSWSRSFAVSGVSGFLAVGFISVLIGFARIELVGGSWPYIGLSILIGLSGKQQDQLIQTIWEWFFAFIKKVLGSKDNDP